MLFCYISRGWNIPFYLSESTHAAGTMRKWLHHGWYKMHENNVVTLGILVEITEAATGCRTLISIINSLTGIWGADRAVHRRTLQPTPFA